MIRLLPPFRYGPSVAALSPAGTQEPEGTADLRVYLAGEPTVASSWEDDERFAMLYETSNPVPQAGTFE